MDKNKPRMLVDQNESRHLKDKEESLTFGHITIDNRTRCVSNSSQKIALSRKEFAILEFMARNKNRIVNRLTILEYIWNYRINTETNTLEVHIAGLRKKLKKYNAHKMLKTVHGCGYMLNDTSD